MNPPKMPIHIGDYKRDTGHLRAAEHGAYLLLLFHHWSTGSLPDDDRQLSAIACMTPAEWKKAKPIISKFFGEGWRHGRVEKDLASAVESYEKRAKAGEKGGKAKATAKQSSSIATAQLEQPLTFNQGKKDSEANASDAGASDDPRKRLFNEGLTKLAKLTGKGPDACRSFVGKCLSAAGDSAIVVLGLIEDAERNQVVDPAAWIAARLKPQEKTYGAGKIQSGNGSLIAAIDRQLASLEAEGGADPALPENPVLRLSGGSIR
ncbi:DUF1376 domain-containing protein [Bradyrhizobium sp. Arg816]|uniref:YdaU family protein n=1 Tax=Bradyrhizobium sp. Arg816 TaxID=2998491 RepID=UPI00249DCC29|nr:DUF1376 domain-containing protein [Bradyrhizobium sp. Arg816]MDI3563539.1 DUF1376 domain-containing protein [Bradyrhizobium sp. Arg816]